MIRFRDAYSVPPPGTRRAKKTQENWAGARRFALSAVCGFLSNAPTRVYNRRRRRPASAQAAHELIVCCCSGENTLQSSTLIIWFMSHQDQPTMH